MSFKDVGGNDHLKLFMAETLAHRQQDPLFMPKGVFLTGVSGAGKSLSAYALGNEVNRPVLKLDVGALMGGVVGQTEANTRAVLRKAVAMAPCILMIDEVEKALAGVGSSGKSDSGVKAGLFGTFLTFMNHRTADV